MENFIFCAVPKNQNTFVVSMMVKVVIMMFVKVKFGKYNELNPFLPNVSFLYILKTSEIKKFSDAFKVYKRGH